MLGADFQGFGCAASPEDAVIAVSEKLRDIISFGAVDVGNQYETIVGRAQPALSLSLSTKNQDGHRKRMLRRLPPVRRPTYRCAFGPAGTPSSE